MERCNPSGTRTKKGQTYTAEKKAKIVLELLKEKRTINQTASKYKVIVKSVSLPVISY